MKIITPKRCISSVTWSLAVFMIYAFSFQLVFSQNVVIETTNNTACQGVPCGVIGPKIVINEFLVAPATNDGSISGPGPNGGRAEWIELYNPDACNSVDISCYIIGSFTQEGSGAIRIPNNTIIPPSGFAVIRGTAAPAVPASSLVSNGGNTVQIVVASEVNNPGICAIGNPGNRVWFPNSGGWFAIYDSNGVPQDAARWGTANSQYLGNAPCVPALSGCSNSTSLASYNDIPPNRKFHTTTANGFGFVGLTIRRLPDGGIWSSTGTPTMGLCNSTCYNNSIVACTGTATVISAPGNPPYTYQWNDPQNQTLQHAIGLCVGSYTVTVTSSDGIVSTGNATINLYTPPITLNNAEFCINGGIQPITGFSPTVGQMVNFSGPGVSNGQFNPNTSGIGNHNITFNYTDQSGCSNSKNAIFSVLPIPTVTLNLPLSACITDSPIDVLFTPIGGTLSGPGIIGSQFHPNLAGAGQHQITYQFTDPLGCTNPITTVLTANITVNGLTTPTFPVVPSFCANTIVPNLPTTSTNGYTGVWSPAINNTQTTTYTYTPNDGQCAANTTKTITIIQNVLPTFNQYGAFCQGASIPALPTSSLNGFTGTWSPAINNQQTTSYTFTPSIGQCSTSAEMTINITPNVNANFNDAGPFCAGASVPNLPNTSLNNYTGTWSPAINNQQTTTYNWTPNFGQCANPTSKTITIIQNTTPTFSQLGPFCAGDNIPAITSNSNNGFTGTWSPIINNQQTTTYNWIPNFGQCATPTSMTINVIQNTPPTFTPLGSFCAGVNIPTISPTSNNGFTGIWSPAINNQQTTTYNWIPNSGQCATPASMTITIVPNATPTFNPMGSFCFDANIPAIPLTSINGFSGTWSPAINNQQTTTYSWTPNSGQCATPTTMTIAITPNVDANFNNVGPFCEGANIPALPTTSLNNFTGVWTPSINNQQTTTYTWVPNFGQCANTASTTITINPNLTPAFSQIDPVCLGNTIPSLPILSLNNFTGSWSPSLNNSATTTYTFTPTSGQCAVSTTMTISVLPNLTPTFSAVNPFCAGANVPDLPTTSLNNLTGTWTPGINNLVTTNYTFTPDPNQCATSANLSITIIPNLLPTFAQFGPYCSGANIPDLPLTSINNFSGTWSPNIDNSQTTTYTFTPNAGVCAIPTTTTIEINPILLPIFDQIPPTCAGTNIPTLPTTSLNNMMGTWSPLINNTQTTTYTFTPAPSECAVDATMEIEIVTGPVVLTCPSNQNISCITLLEPSLNTLTDFQNAGGIFQAENALLVPNSFVLLTDSNNGSSCNQTILRTYQFNNVCSQIAICTQSIVVNDNIPPTGIGPNDIFVTCISDVPAPNINLITNTADNCSAPIVTFVNDLSVGSCPEIITRKYRVKDACNNQFNINQIITVWDTIAPTGFAPPNIVVQCIQDVPQPNVNGLINVADNCVPPTVSHLNDVSVGSCPIIITRTYRITDSCGNFTDVQQIITVLDTIAPTGNAPQNLNVQCVGDVPAPNINTLTNVSDNCVVPTVFHLSDVSVGNCPQIISRTYRIQDLCGNFTDVVQTITVLDTIPPTGTPPANITVNCTSEVPIPDVNLVTNISDNCQFTSVFHHSDISDGNVCNQEIITRTYRIVDLCGNETFVSHTITINLITPNSFLSVTNPTTCQGNDGTITLTSLFNNTAYNISFNNQTFQAVSSSFGQIQIPNLSQGIYSDFIITYNSCNFCSQLFTQNIELQDPPGPEIDAGNDLSFCSGNSFFLQANNPEVAALTWSNNIQDGTIVTPPVGLNIYTVTAVLNNCLSTDSVAISVFPLPLVNAGSDMDVCEGVPIILAGTGAQTYFWNNNVTDGVPFYQMQPLVSYHLIGVDQNGCFAEDDIDIVLLENPYPTFTNNIYESCEVPFSVLFDNTSSLEVVNCSWQFDNFTSTTGTCNQAEAVFEQIGCYGASLTVEYINGCTNSTYTPNVACVRPVPTSIFFAAPSSQLVESEIYFTNASQNATSYFWYFDDESPALTNKDIVYSYSNSGQYDVILVAVNEYGCSDTSRQILYINNPVLFFVPNAFTPDGDAYNNEFKPIMASGFDPFNYELTIFNRVGEIMFVSKNANFGWPGTYDGKLVQQGTYIWQIWVKNEKGISEMHRGHVTVLR